LCIELSDPQPILLPELSTVTVVSFTREVLKNPYGIFQRPPSEECDFPMARKISGSLPLISIARPCAGGSAE
jgi:hypothetical protein